MNPKKCWTGNALKFPHISFCIHVWGTTVSVHHQRLYVLQKKNIRIICGFHPRTHTEPLYKTLHILTADHIGDYSILLFMYELPKVMLLSMFENMFIHMSNVYNHSTRQTDLLNMYVQYASTKRTQRTIKHYGTKLWNCICHSSIADCAINTFKHKFENFLFVMIFFTLLYVIIISLLFSFSSSSLCQSCNLFLLVNCCLSWYFVYAYGWPISFVQLWR